MKFAEHITESSIPEWRDKYIDYKLGKKKIKQCRKYLETVNKDLFGSKSSLSLSNSGYHTNCNGNNNQSQTNARTFNNAFSSGAQPFSETTSLLHNTTGKYTKEQLKCINEFINDWVVKSELKESNDFYLWELQNVCKAKYQGLELQMKIYTKRKENGLFLRENHNEYYSGDEHEELHNHDEPLNGRIYQQNHSPEQDYDAMGNMEYGADAGKHYPKRPSTLSSLTINGCTSEDEVRSISFLWKGQETFVISDDQASRQLSSAIVEFYLYLELLKSFRSVNLEGFRKIVKKFDKLCKTNELQSFLNNVLYKTDLYKDSIKKNDEDEITKWERKLTQWYVYDLAKSTKDRKVRSRFLANSTIQANMDELSVHKSNLCSMHMFLSGLNIGISSCIIGLALYYGSQSTVSSELHKKLLPIWGGWYLVTLMSLLFQLDCYIWFKNKVNYRFIIFGEILPTSKFGTSLFHNDFASTRIPSHLYFSSTLLLLCCVSSFFSLSLTKKLEPWITLYWVLLLIILTRPQFFVPYMGNFSISSFWNLKTLIRLTCSGLYPVKFSDFFLGDMVCSLTYSLSDIALYFCMIQNNPRSDSCQCGSSRSYSMGILTAIPSYFRMVQCVRRYFDSGDSFPHLLNAGKYFLTICYFLLLMLFRIKPPFLQGVNIRLWFIIIATLNSVFSALWDIILDWSLFQSLDWSTFLLRKDMYIAGTKNWKNGRYPWKGRMVYYMAIIIDFIIRFQWLAYIWFPSEIQQNAMVSLAIAFAEMFRRFIWMIFRIENEHVANVNLFKISAEIRLPYNIGSEMQALYMQNRKKATPSDAEPVQSSAVSISDEVVEYAPTMQEPPLARSPPHHRPMRRGSTLEMVAKAIPWAHLADFQRDSLDTTLQKSDAEQDNNANDPEDDDASVQSAYNSDSDND
ncbi:hypothetical protein ACO0QE_004513 [Hanseniaspora vineae]